MLESLCIENFRLFKIFQINKLARINLFAGKNNSGKSCLLDAIQIFASNGDPQLLNKLINRRDETWDYFSEKITSPPSIATDSPFRHLFNGYLLPSDGKNDVRIGPLYKKEKSVIIRVSDLLVDKNTSYYKSRKHTNDTIKLANSDIKKLEDVKRLGIVISQGEQNLGIIDLEDDYPPKPTYLSFSGEKYNIQEVSYFSSRQKKTPALWDAIALTDSQQDVLDCLRMLVPHIVGISFIDESSDRSNRNRIPIVKSQLFEERLPLKSFGDGVSHIFHIILRLVNAKNGYLLIDEFENGLHWSIQTEIWEKIFIIARNLNVQVFATTHSRDCIESFFKAWKRNKGEASFHRLDVGKNGDTSATPYDLTDLSDALETQVEVR